MDLSTSDASVLIEIIKEQTTTISSLRQTLEEMNTESRLLREQIDYLTKKLFGVKSEKSSVLTGQILLEGMEFGEFDEAESNADFEEVEELVTRQKTRKGYSREKALMHLPQEDRQFTISEADKICEIDGDRRHFAGKKYIRSEIEYIPATMKIINIYQETWECRTCRKEERPYLKQAGVDAPLIQHSMASPSSVAWTMYQKYVNHIPLYRQEKDWQNLGMQVKRSTLSNWILKTSEEYLGKMVERLHQQLLMQDYLHADETPVQVMNEPEKKNTSKSYMWVYTSSKNSTKPIRVFEYKEGRSGSNAVNFLKGYEGYLHTDGFSGYGKVENITRCLCWSHARRHFADALPKNLKSPEATLPLQAIEYFKKLFEVEDKLKDLSPEDRKKERLRQQMTVLEAYWSWVENNSNRVLPKSRIGKALQYSINQREGLMRYLEDGNCDMTNNTAENSIRPFTVGRKNWLFAGSPNGAHSSAIVYSLVETAKANGINPYKYLQLLLSAIPKLDMEDPMSLDRFLPWDPKVREACKIL